jgi:hypothetical protein
MFWCVLAINSIGQVQVCNVQYVLHPVNRCDRFSMIKPLRSSARGASFHTKHASNANVVRVVLLDSKSTWHSEKQCTLLPSTSAMQKNVYFLPPLAGRRGGEGHNMTSSHIDISEAKLRTRMNEG